MLVKTLVISHFNYCESVPTDMTVLKELKIITFALYCIQLELG